MLAAPVQEQTTSTSHRLQTYSGIAALSGDETAAGVCSECRRRPLPELIHASELVATRVLRYGAVHHYTTISRESWRA
jgi:hypothetical protein